MKLSVVITHYRERQLLERCVGLLQKELEDIESEIIVVLSEYRPETLVALKKEFSDIIFLPFEKNLYFVRSVNKGLERATGDYILIINDDVMVSSGSVKTLLSYLKEHGAVGLVGPKLLYPDGSDQLSCFRFYTPLTVVCRRTFLGGTNLCAGILKRFLYSDKNLNDADGAEVDWLVNGAVMARRDFIKQAGFLDERFRHYFSDVDWCRRFWQNGFKVVYFPKAVFYHHHGRRSGGNGLMGVLTNRMTRIHIRDGIKYFWKWGIKISLFCE